MGVIYKLKQEIIDFIVQKKKNDPALSCRKLEVAIKDQFGISISKSSVNDVIKEFKLSGPVGRPSVFKAPKNFFIPQEKKETLLKSVELFLTPVEGPPVLELPKIVDAPQGVHKQEVMAESFAEVPVEPTQNILEVVPEIPLESFSETVPEDDRALLLRPDPVASSSSLEKEALAEQLRIQAEVSKKQKVPGGGASIWLGDTGIVYGRLGVAALWFAFKSACAKSFLGEALARAMGTLPDGVSAEQCEAVLFASFLAEHRPGFESDDLRTLWRLTGLEDTKGRALLEKATVLEGNNEALAAVRTELAIAFTPVNYFRLLTRKGARFYMDASSLALHHEFIDAGDGGALPVFMAVERAVDRIITNVLPVIADVSASGLNPEVLQFMRCMEGAGADDELCGVELIGDHDVRCAEFPTVPLIRRGVILRVRLSEGALGRVEHETIGNKKIFFDSIRGIECRYFEGLLALDGFDRPLRVLTGTVSVDAEEFEIVLLSNILSGISKSEDILGQFFSFQNPELLGIHKTNKLRIDMNAPQFVSMSSILREIDTLSRKFFFTSANDPLYLNWEGMCEVLYDLSGVIKETSQALFIRLEVPEKFMHHERLGFFLKELNRASFKTSDNKIVIFSI